MIDSLADWAAAFCTVSVICAFGTFLIPNGTVKKTANIVMTLFMLSVAVIPFSEYDLSDISEILDVSSDITEDMNEYTMRLNEYLLENGKLVTKENIESLLDEICDDEFSVEIEMEINKDGNPELKNTVITVSKSDSSKIIIIKSKVASLTGEAPEVKIQ